MAEARHFGIHNPRLIQGCDQDGWTCSGCGEKHPWGREDVGHCPNCCGKVISCPTRVDRKGLRESLVGIISYPDCKHKNGWFVYPRFWIFKRRYLSCFDCGELIPKGGWSL